MRLHVRSARTADGGSNYTDLTYDDEYDDDDSDTTTSTTTPTTTITITTTSTTTTTTFLLLLLQLHQKLLSTINSSFYQPTIVEE
jgi:hypothetical protein